MSQKKHRTPTHAGAQGSRAAGNARCTHRSAAPDDSSRNTAPRFEPLEPRQLLASTINLPDVADIAINKVAAQSDSKIVVAGSIGGTGNEDFFLARFNADGTLDTTFAAQGYTRTDFGSDDAALALGIDSQGRIVAAGAGGPKHDFAVARYLPNGQLDPNFAHSGERLIPFGGNDTALALALTADDKIILAGARSGDNLVPYAAVPMAELNADGSFNTTFNHTGTALLFGENSRAPDGFNPFSINAISVAPDGKIFLAWDARVSTAQDLSGQTAVVMPDGTAQYSQSAATETTSTAIAVTPGGTVILGINDTFDEEGNFDRFHEDFSEIGALPPVFPQDVQAQTGDILVQPDGRIIVFESPFPFGDELPPGIAPSAARFTNVDTSPTLDPTFGQNGIAPISGDHPALDSQGRIVTAGNVVGGIAVSRYTSSGKLDDSFANGGTLTIGSASITGRVFNDTNADGLFDNSDAGISGFRVFLDANNNGILDAGEFSAPVSSTGTYHFTNVPAGEYHVMEVPRAGWRQTFPAKGFYDINLAAGQTAKNLTFANTNTVLIKGTVYLDANKNKTQDTAEPGLAGWYVYIDTNNDGTFDKGDNWSLTDANGNYRFYNLPAGTYIVRVLNQSRYKPTTPASFTVTLAAGQTTSHKNFGEKRTA